LCRACGSSVYQHSYCRPTLARTSVLPRHLTKQQRLRTTLASPSVEFLNLIFMDCSLQAMVFINENLSQNGTTHEYQPLLAKPTCAREVQNKKAPVGKTSSLLSEHAPYQSPDSGLPDMADPRAMETSPSQLHLHKHYKQRGY